MGKMLVKKIKFEKRLQGHPEVLVSDFPALLSTDIIEINRVESFYSENESYDEYTELIVAHLVEETDEEYNTRVASFNRMIETSRKNRYQRYLELKEEFEPKEINNGDTL